MRTHHAKIIAHIVRYLAPQSNNCEIECRFGFDSRCFVNFSGGFCFEQNWVLGFSSERPSLLGLEFYTIYKYILDKFFFFGWYLRTFLIFYCGILETQTQHLNMFNCIVKFSKRKHFSMNILGGQSHGHGLLLRISC